MRVILDTNVLISGIFFKGPPHNILRAWRDKRCELIVSEEIFQEYINVCERLQDKYPGIEFQKISDRPGVLPLGAKVEGSLPLFRKVRRICG